MTDLEAAFDTITRYMEARENKPKPEVGSIFLPDPQVVALAAHLGLPVDE